MKITEILTLSELEFLETKLIKFREFIRQTEPQAHRDIGAISMTIDTLNCYYEDYDDEEVT